MKQESPQIMTDADVKDNKKRKKRNKKWIVLFSVIAAVVIVSVAGILYVNLYKIPHDEAINNFNNSVEQFNIAKDDLEKKNKELDDGIASFSQVVYAEDIPVDELLLSDAYSVLEEARGIVKDSAPAIPEMPKKTEEINAEATKIQKLATEMQAMGGYSDIIEQLSATETEYRTMIEQFKNCTTEVVWTGVDTEYTVLRFVVKISNSNPYPLRGVTTEWIAYDKNDAIVGSHEGVQPDVPANGCVFYVGGSGSANLSGTPVRVEVKIKTEGLLTNRVLPNISVSDVQLEDNGYNWFTVSAECITNSDINTADLHGQIIVKNADGEIIDADFWNADKLPDSIDANGKFMLSEDFLDLPAVPDKAEVYLYYVWQ